MKFLHCADLHLDSPLKGLERYEGAPVEEVRGATRRALENLVTLALEEQVDCVVIAGDLYDGDWPDFNTGLFFVAQMARLREGGIRVFLVRGNHDAESRITRDLRLPDNVHLLGVERAETVIDDELDLAVHGQSFAEPRVTQDLAAGYPERVKGLFNLGVLHTALTGREGHAPYAPTRLEILRAKEYDYWALGHVHRREIVQRDPWIMFSGNLQGRTIRETGSKGCELVTVEGGRIRTEHRPLDVMRWEILVLDASKAADPEDLCAQFQKRLKECLTEAQGRTLAVRVTVTGRGKVHDRLAAAPETFRQALCAVALDTANGAAWVEKLEVRTQPVLDLEELMERDDPFGEVVRTVHRLRADGMELEPLRAEFKELWAKLPLELREGDEALRLDGGDFLTQVLAEAETFLISEMGGEGDAAG